MGIAKVGVMGLPGSRREFAIASAREMSIGKTRPCYEADGKPMRAAALLVLAVLAGGCHGSASSVPPIEEASTAPSATVERPVGLGSLIGPRLPQTARITEVDVSGRAGDVESNLRSQLLPGARLCFNHGLTLGVAEPGSLSLVLEIQSNGDVSDARVDKSDPSLGSQVVTCVAQRAERAHFTAVDAGTVKVRVGLAFTRPDDAGPEPGGLHGYNLE